MTVERKDDELLVRLSVGAKASKMQSILDYLRYIELTSNSKATEMDIEESKHQSKPMRWEKSRISLARWQNVHNYESKNNMIPSPNDI